MCGALALSDEGGRPMNQLHIRALTAEERAELQQWTRSGKTACYQRARTILLAADAGASGTAIARNLGLHPNTTRRWLHTFEAGGLAALAPKPKGGRDRRFDDAVADALIALLHEPPETHGCTTSRWTLQEAADVLTREGHVEQISHETVRQLLRRRRVSWQRAKEWLTSPDPQYAFKKDGAIAW